MASSSYSVAPFNGKNDIGLWKVKMKYVLVQQKVSKAIDESYEQTDTYAKRKEMDKIAMSSIMLSLLDSVLRKVSDCKTAKQILDKLNMLYTESSLPSRMFLLEKFFKFKLDVSKDLDEGLDAFNKLVQDIKATGDQYIDDYVSIVLLNVIPDSFSNVKSAIKYGRDELTLDIVIRSLKSKELDMRQYDKSSKYNSDRVLYIRGRSTKRYNHKNQNKRGHSNSSHRSQSRPHNRSKFRGRNESNDKRYFNCGKIGHFIKNRRLPKKNLNNNNNNANKNDSSDKNEVNNVTENEKHDEFYMVHDLNCFSDVNTIKGVNEYDWLLDSGCTFHMSPHKKLFDTYREVDDFVLTANDKRCPVLGIGRIILNLENGVKFCLDEVKHVPDLTYNLMSCSVLEKKGFEGK